MATRPTKGKSSTSAAKRGGSTPRKGGAKRPPSAVASKPTLSAGRLVRLQKVLAQGGIASRRAAEELITAGRVSVDGKKVSQLGIKVDPEVARVELDGVPVVSHAPVVIVMNKPDDVVCSGEATVDDRGRPTVVSLLDNLDVRVFPVGRLDYHTRGVLLLTNDGALCAALTHPRSQVPKTYHAKFQGRLGEAQLAALHAGVVLEDGTPTRPALEVEVVRATTTNTWVQLTIAQGLYRQIRRMGEAIGHSVLKLIRVAFAGITADGLREGQWRKLSDDEILLLRETARTSARTAKPMGRGRPSGDLLHGEPSALAAMGAGDAPATPGRGRPSSKARGKARTSTQSGGSMSSNAAPGKPLTSGKVHAGRAGRSAIERGATHTKAAPGKTASAKPTKGAAGAKGAANPAKRRRAPAARATTTPRTSKVPTKARRR